MNWLLLVGSAYLLLCCKPQTQATRQAIANEVYKRDSGIRPPVLPDNTTYVTHDASTPAGVPTAWWQPKPGTSWQWQLTGTIDQSIPAQMYDVDLFDVSTATVASLKAKGAKVIAYFSAGSYENWRPDASKFPANALGKNLEGWAGERWLDIRNPVVRQIMQARLDLAVQKGFDGVEPDNVDGYTNNTGFPLTAADQLDYAKFLATEAHKRGLSIGLKNNVDQVSQLQPHYDWALNEECFKYNECNTLLPFIQAGKAVFNVEYGKQALAQTVCPKANAKNFDTLIKNLDLDVWRIACR